MVDPTRERFAIPRAPWRQKLRPEHIRRRLLDARAIGEWRMPLRERGRLILRQSAHGLRLLLESLRRPVGLEALFLCGNPRSGTSWVGDLLGGHPEIAWGGEMWSPFDPRGLPVMLMPKCLSAWHLRQNLRRQARRQGRRYSAEKMNLTHIASRHFELDEIDRLWPAAKRIILVRRHVGLQYVSFRIALATGQFALRDEADRRSPMLEVDISDFRPWSAMVVARIRAIAAHPMGQRALWLLYEDLDGAPEAAFRDGVWPFLGLPAAPLWSSPLKKQRRGALADRVANYAEVGMELEAAVLPIETAGGRGFSLGPPAGLLP